jgi:hypothetical protein
MIFLVHTIRLLLCLPRPPNQLLIEIHNLSGSSSLPIVNRYTLACLSNPTPRQAATWLLLKYPLSSYPDAHTRLTKSLTHPVCNLYVFKEMERQLVREHTVPLRFLRNGSLGIPNRLWQGLANHTLPKSIVSERYRDGWVFGNKDRNGEQNIEDDDGWSEYSLDDPHLERANPSSADVVFWLLSRWSITLKSMKRGLRYAVFHRHRSTVEFLVTMGVNPIQSGDRYAIEVAARRKDFGMLDVLLKTDSKQPMRDFSVAMWNRMSTIRPMQCLHVEDLNEIAKYADQEVMAYFYRETGLTPDLKNILAL